jgi:prophage maintenance system killer protein
MLHAEAKLGQQLISWPHKWRVGLPTSANDQPTLPQLAAGYAAGIVLNHPFLDGNKRTGFILAVTFLELNGFAFTASEESVVEITVALAAGKVNEADYTLWLRQNSRPARSLGGSLIQVEKP